MDENIVKNLNLLNLPVKNSAKLPHRFSFCISDEANAVINELRELDIDVPKMMRIALDEYIQRNGLVVE